MKTHQNVKSAETIDSAIHYTETLLGIRYKNIKKYRYNAPCPFHADTKNSFMVYVNKDNEVRFHCFGDCKGDWDIYDLIMLRKHYRFTEAQQAWVEYIGVAEFTFDAGSSACIPEPDETPEPDDPVVFVEPLKRDQKDVATLEEAALFYNDLLLLNENRLKHIWDYLARRGRRQRRHK